MCSVSSISVPRYNYLLFSPTHNNYSGDANTIWIDTAGQLRVGNDKVAVLSQPNYLQQFDQVTVFNELSANTLRAHTSVTTQSVATTTLTASTIACDGVVSAAKLDAREASLASLNVGRAVYGEGGDTRCTAKVRSSLELFHASARLGLLDGVPGLDDHVLHVNGASFHIRLFAPAVFGAMEAAEARKITDTLATICADMDQSTMDAFAAYAHTGSAGGVLQAGNVFKHAVMFHIATCIANIIRTSGSQSLYACRWQWMADHVAAGVRAAARVGPTPTSVVPITPCDIIKFATLCVPLADDYSPGDPYVLLLCDLCLLWCGAASSGCFVSTLSHMHWSLALAVNRALCQSSRVSNGFLTPYVGSGSDASSSPLVNVVQMPYAAYGAKLASVTTALFGVAPKAASSSSPSGGIRTLRDVWNEYGLPAPDFRISVRDTDADFMVHRWLVAGVWPYFRRVLQASLAESQQAHLEFESARFPPDLLGALIKRIYGVEQDPSFSAVYSHLLRDEAFLEEFELKGLMATLFDKLVDK